MTTDTPRKPDGTRSASDVLCLVCLLVVCAATAFVGAVPTRSCGQDNFFLLDNGWRIVCGQRPHLDFSSSWGPVTFLVMGMGLTLSGGSADGIGYGNAVFGLMVGLWALWLGRRRLSAPTRTVLSLYLALLATAPFPLGFWPNDSSHAMLYNRYGYALLALVLLECFQRREGAERQADAMSGGISTGAVAAITLFLKANYFVVSLPLIAASFLFRQPDRRRTVGLALGFLIVLVAMLAYLRFDLDTLAGAYRAAAGARSRTVFLFMLILQLKTQIPSLLVVLGLLFFGFRRTKPPGSRLDDRQLFLWALVVLASDSLLMFSNTQAKAMPLLGAFAIMIADRMNDERQRLVAAGAQSESRRHVFVLVLCSVMVLPQLVSDAIGLVNGVYQKGRPSTSPGLVRFTEPHLRPLILYDGDDQKAANGSVYTSYVNDGVALLRRHCDASDRVLNMDAVNPFPYALKWRPPLGGIAAIAFNFTLSAQHRPTFDAYFGNATVVLLPKRSATMRYFIDGFYALYTPALLERYRLCAESDWFRLYRRK